MSRHFRIYALNIIKDHSDDGKRNIFAHCEVQDETGIGGEAFSLNITETNESSLWNSMERGIFYINKYNEIEVINKLQKFLDVSKPNNWQELKVHVTRFFDWV